MRKKLDTRFPAARIKKIMQADEDVGKIAMAVPVLVSKALELFLQDLCDRTYDITLQRGAKTMSSLHLKHCIHRFSTFDFLKDVVKKVPDYGHSDANADDRTAVKRRKPAADEYHESDEELKKTRMQEMGHASSSGRGRGRARGRGRGRGRPPVDREPHHHHDVEAEPSTSFEPYSKPSPIQVPNADDNSDPHKDPMKESPIVSDGGDMAMRNFDLNAEVAETQEATVTTKTGDASSVEPSPPEVKSEELVSEVDGMAIDPHQIAQFNTKIQEDDDYDEE